jgi:hypothetical protein
MNFKHKYNKFNAKRPALAESVSKELNIKLESLGYNRFSIEKINTEKFIFSSQDLRVDVKTIMKNFGRNVFMKYNQKIQSEYE